MNKKLEIEDYIAKSMAILMGYMKGSPYEERALEQVIKQGNRLLEKMD